MNMTDMLLQMTLQSAWQLPELSQSSGQTASDNQGTSFQDLLAQRQESLNKPGSGKTESQKPQEGAEDTEKPVQDDSMPGKEAVLQNLLLGTPLMLENPTVGVPQEMIQQPVQTAETAAVLPAAVLPQQSGVVQAEGEAAQGVTLPQQANPIQTQPSAEAGAEPETAAVAFPKVGEAVTPTGTEPDAADTQPRDMAQSLPRQEQTQEPEPAVVTHWQTPLFQDVEASPVRVGDTVVDMTAPAQEVQTALGDALKGAAEQGEQHLEIQLSPANLGKVVAEFTRSPEGILHVVLRAETEQTAKLLSDHAPTLSLMLQDSSRGEVRVEVPQPQQNQSAWQQPDQDGGGRQQQQQQQQHAPRQETESFFHQLRLGLVQMEEEAV